MNKLEERPGTSPVDNKKTILVVEDDRDVNDLICAVLEDDGYETVSATTGAGAMDIIKKDSPDLVLLDYLLPDIQGVDFIGRLHEDPVWSDIPVIVVSGKSDIPTKIASFSAGARRYINKPFRNEDLLREVANTFIQLERTKEAKEYHDRHGFEGDYGNFERD